MELSLAGEDGVRVGNLVIEKNWLLLDCTYRLNIWIVIILDDFIFDKLDHTLVILFEYICDELFFPIIEYFFDCLIITFTKFIELFQASLNDQ